MITREELEFFEDSVECLHPNGMMKLRKEFCQRMAATCREYLDLVNPDVYRPTVHDRSYRQKRLIDLITDMFKK